MDKTINIETCHFSDDGTVPNNSLPAVLCRGALPTADPVTGEAAPLLECWGQGSRQRPA